MEKARTFFSSFLGIWNLHGCFLWNCNSWFLNLCFSSKKHCFSSHLFLLSLFFSFWWKYSHYLCILSPLVSPLMCAHVVDDARTTHRIIFLLQFTSDFELYRVFLDTERVEGTWTRNICTYVCLVRRKTSTPMEHAASTWLHCFPVNFWWSVRASVRGAACSATNTASSIHSTIYVPWRCFTHNANAVKLFFGKQEIKRYKYSSSA